MKKSIIILAMALMSFSCSTEEATNNNTDCDCGVVTFSQSFNVINGSGGVNTFSVIKVKNNCTEQITQTQVNGTINVGSQYCN